VHSAREPLDGGAATVALQATERLAGSVRTVQFLPEVSALRNWGPLVVPADQFFFLGDNRDNSADSRYIGLVPRHLLIGQAHHILVSAAIKDDWLPAWNVRASASSRSSPSYRLGCSGFRKPSRLARWAWR